MIILKNSQSREKKMKIATKKLLRNTIIVAMKTTGPLIILILAVWIIMGIGIQLIVTP